MFNEFEKNNRGMRVNRRTVLRGTSGIVGTALVAPLVSAQSEGPVSFTHGVASGDPLQDRVILWTRVAPSDNTARNLQIEWQVSADKEFANVIASGGGSSGPASDFTFKTDASGLKADRTYYYRFTCEGVTSETGRTRTLAASGTDPLSLAVVSCSNYPQGFFHVYKEIAKRDVAMVLHLGDYLYEYPAGGYSNERMTGEFGRKVDPKGEVIALDDYRRRYALYRTDPDLQAVHAAHHSYAFGMTTKLLTILGALVHRTTMKAKGRLKRGRKLHFRLTMSGFPFEKMLRRTTVKFIGALNLATWRR